MATNQCPRNYKMSDQEIKVPNIGEFKNVEVIEVLVSNGQSVSKNDPLITIESDKSSVEIPSSFKGKIKSVNVKVGDKISEGNTILILEPWNCFWRTGVHAHRFRVRSNFCLSKKMSLEFPCHQKQHFFMKITPSKNKNSNLLENPLFQQF